MDIFLAPILFVLVIIAMILHNIDANIVAIIDKENTEPEEE